MAQMTPPPRGRQSPVRPGFREGQFFERLVGV